MVPDRAGFNLDPHPRILGAHPLTEPGRYHARERSKKFYKKIYPLTISLTPFIISTMSATKPIGHRIVVEGFYWATVAPHEGADGVMKVRRAFSEEFALAPHKSRDLSIKSNALSHVIGDALPARLLAADPAYRALASHDVAEHENFFDDGLEEQSNDA